MHGAADVVGRRLPLEHLEQAGLEGLRAERDAAHAARAQELGELGRHRLGIRLDRHLRRSGKRAQEARQLPRLGERRRAPTEEHGFHVVGQDAALQLELGQQRVDVRARAARAGRRP